jgi:hypothetical protein
MTIGSGSGDPGAPLCAPPEIKWIDPFVTGALGRSALHPENPALNSNAALTPARTIRVRAVETFFMQRMWR